MHSDKIKQGQDCLTQPAKMIVAKPATVIVAEQYNLDLVEKGSLWCLYSIPSLDEQVEIVEHLIQRRKKFSRLITNAVSY